jgi:hypothetical protein
VLAVLLLVTNIFAQEGDIFDTPTEQETIRLESTIPSTAPVAVVEAFKVVVRERKRPGAKKQYSKMRLNPVDATAQQKLSQKVDLLLAAASGDTLALDARKSYDDNQDKISFKWASMSAMDFEQQNETAIGFRIPEVMIEQIFLFKVTLNDGRYNTNYLVGIKAKPVQTVSYRGLQHQVAQSGEKVQISAIAPGAIRNQDLSYLWRAPDGIALSSNTEPDISFKVPTTDTDSHYILFLAVSGPKGDVVDRDSVRVTVKSKSKNKKAIIQGLNTKSLPAARVAQINQFLQSTIEQGGYIDVLDPELYASLATSPKNYFYPGGYQKPAKSPYEPVFNVRCNSLADATENSLAVGGTDVIAWDFKKNDVLKLNYYSVFNTASGEPSKTGLQSAVVPLKMADRINLSTTIVLDDQGAPIGMTDIRPAVENALQELFSGKKAKPKQDDRKGSQDLKARIQQSINDTIEFYKSHPEVLAVTALIVGGLTIAIFGGDKDLGMPPDFPFE